MHNKINIEKRVVRKLHTNISLAGKYWQNGDTMQNERAKKLRQTLSETKFLTLPGIYDCLSAKIAEEAGFPALFLSGGALAYSVLGRPDFGFLSLAEFGTAIQHIVSTVDLPLIADADNGFGNAIQAANTGAMYEQLGAAGLQIDDKVLPANHPAKDEIIKWELMGPKIKAVRSAVSDVPARSFTILESMKRSDASIWPKTAALIMLMWMELSLWKALKKFPKKHPFLSWSI